MLYYWWDKESLVEMGIAGRLHLRVWLLERVGFWSHHAEIEHVSIQD